MLSAVGEAGTDSLTDLRRPKVFGLLLGNHDRLDGALRELLEHRHHAHGPAKRSAVVDQRHAPGPRPPAAAADAQSRRARDPRR